jgi:hypothetical protein
MIRMAMMTKPTIDNLVIIMNGFFVLST